MDLNRQCYKAGLENVDFVKETEKTRKQIRQSIEEHGGFIEVHVATPITECEKRDRKGMYAKARMGELKGFTGIDDPYEPPFQPEIRLETINRTPEQNAQLIKDYLIQRGVIQLNSG